MDDLNHNCASCHEVTRTPSEHHCGRTPEGTLPAHQPHKAGTVNDQLNLPETWSLIKKALKPYEDALKAIQRAANKPNTQDDYTIAGPPLEDS